MATPGVLLELNYARQEVLRPGWGLTKTAGAFRGASWDGEKWVPGSLGFEMVAGNPVDSANLWQEAETGVVLLRPNAFRDDLVTSSAWESCWISDLSGRGQLQFDPDDLEKVEHDEGSKPVWFHSKLASASASLNGLGTVPDHLEALNVESRFGMKWVARTAEMLSDNEGFAVYGQAYGVATDRQNALMGGAFGQRWYVQIGMNAEAAIYENAGTPTAPNWVRRKRFELQGGSLNADFAFMLAVIPWGIDGISVVFSQQPIAKDLEQASTGASEGASLYLCRKHGYTPPWDAAAGHWVKTEADQLTVALRSDVVAGFSLLKVRYAACGLRLAPEVLDEAKPGKTPTVLPIGYEPMGSGGFVSDTSSTHGASYTNERGVAWDDTKDTKIVAATWLKPSAGGKYTPEVWAMEYDVETTTHNPALTAIDLSERWQKICFKLTAEPKGSPIDVRYLRNGDWANLLKLDGQLRLTVDGIEVCDGPVTRAKPTMSGGVGILNGDGVPRSTIMVVDDLEAEDGWSDFASESAAYFPSLTNKTLGAVFEKVFERAGVGPSSYVIDSALYEIYVDGWDRPNDWKLPNENDSLEDVLCGLIERYGLQGNGGGRTVRCHKLDGVWTAYLDFVYDPAVAPSLAFFLDDRCLPAGSPYTDAERYAGIEGVRWLRLFEQPEITVCAPRFNAVRAFASAGTGDGSDMFSCYIPPEPAAMTDPLDPDYQRRARWYTLGPPETAMATTQNELERIARRFYDEHCVPERWWAQHGEWQPGVWPAMICSVFGIAPEDGGDFAAGDVVSYGAWRIETIAGEIRSDAPAVPAPDGSMGGAHGDDRKWTRTGLYTLRYVGETDPEVVGVPMFSAMLPRQGRIS